MVEWYTATAFRDRFTLCQQYYKLSFKGLIKWMFSTLKFVFCWFLSWHHTDLCLPVGVHQIAEGSAVAADLQRITRHPASGAAFRVYSTQHPRVPEIHLRQQVHISLNKTQSFATFIVVHDIYYVALRFVCFNTSVKNKCFLFSSILWAMFRRQHRFRY